MGTKLGGRGLYVAIGDIDRNEGAKAGSGPGLITPVNSQRRQCHWKSPTAGRKLPSGPTLRRS